MDEKEVVFNELVEEYKKLSTDDKRSELISDFKELIAMFDAMVQSENFETKYMKNREILDLKKEDVSEDDFLEALFVYLHVAEDVIGQYLEKKNI